VHYSTIVVFFICLIQKDQPFAWGVEVEIVFQFLKVFFTITLFLICVNLSKIFILEMDIFYFALNIVLSHATWRDDFHLVDFYFHKVFPIENNNEILCQQTFCDCGCFWRVASYTKRTTTWHVCVFQSQELLISHDHSCFEWTFSSMSIFIAPTPTCHHILS